MALRTIVQDGDPILKKKCRPVTNYDARLAQLLDDMRDTLEDAQGYGLAAPQVGVSAACSSAWTSGSLSRKTASARGV